MVLIYSFHFVLTRLEEVPSEVRAGVMVMEHVINISDWLDT